MQIQAVNVAAFAVLPSPGPLKLTVDRTAVFDGMVAEGQELRCSLDGGWKAAIAERRKDDPMKWRAWPVATSDRELLMEGVESPLADWIADAMRRTTGADVALYSRYAYRGLPLPKGTVDMVDLIQASRPFEQMLVTTQLRGRELLEILDANVLDAADKAKIDRLVQVSGMNYDFDRRRPKGSRIVSSDLEPDRIYTVALEGQVPERQTFQLAGRFGTMLTTKTEIPFVGALYAHATSTGRIAVETGRIREVE